MYIYIYTCNIRGMQNFCLFYKTAFLIQEQAFLLPGVFCFRDKFPFSLTVETAFVANQTAFFADQTAFFAEHSFRAGS